MEKILAFLFLENSDREKYGELLEDYVIPYAIKNNMYPNTFNNMMEVMSKIEIKRKNQGGE